MSSGTNSGVEQLLITRSNKTPLIEILIWILFATSFLSVAARLATKALILRKLQQEDYLVLTSLLFALGQSLAVAIQCANGLGQFMTTLSHDEITALLKAGYAAGLLYIASICMAKVSIVTFIIDLTPVVSHKRVGILSGGLIILWMIASLFTASFQCRLPKTWDSLHNTCFNLTYFWRSFAIINIISDSYVIFTIAFITLRLRTGWLRKVTIIVIFGTRVFVIGATACQIYYMEQPVKDPIFDVWQVSISTQVVQCLSIVTACIPYLKPFLASLESGLMRADDLRRRGDTDPEYYSIYKMQKSDRSGSKKSSVLGNFLSNKRSSSSAAHELSLISRPPSSKLQLRPDQAVVANILTIEGEGTEWDGQSHSSQDRIIKQTRTWKVQVQDGNGKEVAR